jgi:hypothetical protein
MATILIEFAFDDVWLCDVTNPAVTVAAGSPEREQTANLDGDVRYYAGGRARVITSQRDARTYPLTLTQLTVADVDLLMLWRGRVVLARDGLGRRVFGTFFSVGVSDRYLVGGWRSTVTISLTEVTYDESAAV